MGGPVVQGEADREPEGKTKRDGGKTQELGRQHAGSDADAD
jgi:hypothetical protein